MDVYPGGLPYERGVDYGLPKRDQSGCGSTFFLTPKRDHFVDKDILVQCSLGIDVKGNFD